MHQAIPYRAWIPTTTTSVKPTQPRTVAVDDVAAVGKIVSENAVVVLGRRGCCMTHVLKLLLLGHGVNPADFAVNEEDELRVINELDKLIGAAGVGKGKGKVKEKEKGKTSLQFPVVFIGGKMFGGLERVMAAHISGELVPALKDAGALWL